jgi:EAL domain-containing protein (putative c-di-GMP-specific phosphodiesterase class I)
VDYQVKILDSAKRFPELCEMKRCVLLVDDNPLVLRCLKRALDACPLPIETCASAGSALEWVASGNVEVVISDVDMPGTSGLELLRQVHALDADLPVALLTGVPCVDTAAEAVEHGAFSYLLKPVDINALLRTIARASQAHCAARNRRYVLASVWAKHGLLPSPESLQTFENAMQSMWLAYQPIVRSSDRTIAGHEALLRSDTPTLSEPESLLGVAEQLSELNRLGRQVRALAARQLRDKQGATTLFVNLHPQDLLDDELVRLASPLTEVASQVVLEITERAGLSRVEGLHSKLAELRRLGFKIAVDDLGAGYSSLNNVAAIEPEFIKLDMALVRNIECSPTKQKIVSSVVSLAQAMGTCVIAEGIETDAECEAVVGLGCQLLQGFLFARPERELALGNLPGAARHSCAPTDRSSSELDCARSGIYPIDRGVSVKKAL